VEASKDEATRLLALLAAVEILKSVNGVCPKALARAIVAENPYNPELRNMLANCLAMSSSRQDQVEGLKHRIIAFDIRFRSTRNRGDLTEEVSEELRKSYFRGINSYRLFLSGERPYPSRRVRETIEGRIDPDPRLLELVRGLEDLHGAGVIGHPSVTAPSFRIVMDTNAITNPVLWDIMADPRMDLIAPEEVLLELSDWRQYHRIPVELDRVTFLQVHTSVPEEIRDLRSPKKDKTVSECDRKVATLALQERASVIVTADCDLLDNGLEYIFEKILGQVVKVIHPSELVRHLHLNAFPDRCPTFASAGESVITL